MSSSQRSLIRSTISVCLALSLLAAIGRADDAELAAVQGKWIRKQKTPDGTYTLIKEHRGQKTTLTATNEKEEVVYQHTSEFQLERSGKVRLFTFSNRVVTAGPGKGQTQKEPSSYIYRILDGQFIEVRGVLDGDTEPVGMIVWERQKDGT